ncbi:hypothetical protein AC579_6364 [Pseudocercospora musae]|uniref:Uncharacterized protein n=1 Tax=Pseudocercospora musae TaxID=113226 RepID=A0A139HRQ9_9PEZI|nr:hypothetical protein AC579_6364 [Pseudocercospora musae]
MGTWDDGKERQFLMCIIHAQSVSAPDWNAVAEMLNGATGGNPVGMLCECGGKKDEKTKKEKSRPRAKRKTRSKKGAVTVSKEMVKEDEDEDQSPSKKVKTEGDGEGDDVEAYL